MDRRLMSIWFLLFLLYFGSSRFSLDGYELEYVLSSMNVFHGHGPSLAPGFSDCPGIWPTDGETVVFPRQNILQTYLSVPFYAVGAFLFGEQPTIPDKTGYWKLPWGPVVFVSMLNPMLAALLAVLVALISRDLGVASPYHRIVAVLFGITSMNWHYGALGMEVVQTTVLTAAVWAAVRFRMSGRIVWLPIASLFLLMLPNCKKISFIFILPIMLYLIWTISHQHTRILKPSLAILGIGFFSGIIIMTATMIHKFNADPGLLPHFLHTYLKGGFPVIDIAFALTLSPGEGLFVFNPLLVFAFPAWKAFAVSHRPEALLFTGLILILVCALLIIPYVLIDEEWGPRYLFSVIPLMYGAGAKGFLKVRTGNTRKLLIVILILSITLQWLSSMYLGFKMLDIPLTMGISDYTLSVFTPSMSQIWLAATCFVSHIHSLATGESLIFEHREYSNYIGLGGNHRVLRQDLDSYDYPAGGVFTVRWVLSEKGIHWLSPGISLFLKLIADLVLLGMLLGMCYQRLPKKEAISFVSESA